MNTTRSPFNQPFAARAPAPGGGTENGPMPGVSATSTAEIASLSRLVFLDEGLHALIVGPSTPSAQGIAGIALPATAVAAGPSDDYAPVDIALSSGELPGWLDAEGGTIVARVARGGGVLVVTSYGIADEEKLPSLQILNLDGQGAPGEATPEPGPLPPPPPVPREIGLEMIVHIERQGDRQMLAQGWVGTPGQRRRVEAFGIRPLEELRPTDIEYMAYGPAGRQTPWVSDSKLCGTRGRGLPLTGFAVRLAPSLRDRYDVVYEGSFFAGGETPSCRNGEPCLGQILDDSLEAIRLRVIKRGYE